MVRWNLAALQALGYLQQRLSPTPATYCKSTLLFTCVLSFAVQVPSDHKVELVPNSGHVSAVPACAVGAIAVRVNR